MGSKFERRLMMCVGTAKEWEKSDYQNKARALIPVDDLLGIAEAKYDSVSESNSFSPDSRRTGIIRDLLLLELLEWFKHDFFTWTDSPICSKCTGTTRNVGSAPPSQDEIFNGADRVELYECTNIECRASVRFPRYNRADILLQTKTGRCGEWANCFGLICRSLGYETRYVYDFTDHVWVEVYSGGMEPRNRWLHCDPCENTCDNPLLYEAGWGKKLTFIIAASIDDIQDVTWRYTRRKNLQAVVARRNCDERNVVEALLRVRKQLQHHLPHDRKSLLEERWIQEMVEFLNPNSKELKDSELVGRQSGSMAWRLARSEVGNATCVVPDSFAHFQWILPSNAEKLFELTYDPVTDCYVANDQRLLGWKTGAFLVEDIFRKEEHDWKMVYLTRTDNCSGMGKISWKFSLPENCSKTLRIANVSLEMVCHTFHESAKVQLRVYNDVEELQIPDTCYQNGTWRWESGLCLGRSLVVTCELSGGSGDVAWQQAQLFRSRTTPQNAISNQTPFRVKIELQQ